MAGYNLPSRQLVNQNDAAIIQTPRVPRSRFINRFNRLTAFDAGYLVPFLVDEILPGDHMDYDVHAYVRMATPLYPMFSNQRIDTFFFFVPNRLVWENWQKFMGEQDNPGDSIAYTVPKLAVGPQDIGTIYDHMGLPTVDEQVPPGNTIPINTLPFRMYNLIWNQWFRDQNVMNSVPVPKGDTGDTIGTYQLLYRAKSHDYFTSALPWPQKFTAPTVSVGGLAPVLGIGSPSGNAGPAIGGVRESDGLTDTYAAAYEVWDAGTNEVYMKQMGTGDDRYPAVFADLSQSTGVAINTLRQAWMVQSLLERDARGGTRYVELLKSHFGVTNPDFRLQRAEYIGGGQSPLAITPIAQTAPTTGVPLGALGAAGTASGAHRASYAATEHGFVIGLINVKSELAYQQGLHKMWSRSTRYDYYWPALAGLGEQAILRKEIYATGGVDDDTAFGYQERWQEYRTRYSDVTGLMRSFVTSGLGNWHLYQHFGTAPGLDGTFLRDEPPMYRVLAAGELSDNQQYLADIVINRTATRAMTLYGTPALIGNM